MKGTTQQQKKPKPTKHRNPKTENLVGHVYQSAEREMNAAPSPHRESDPHPRSSCKHRSCCPVLATQMEGTRSPYLCPDVAGTAESPEQSRAESSRVGGEEKTHPAYYVCERLVQSSVHPMSVRILSCFCCLSGLEIGTQFSLQNSMRRSKLKGIASDAR